MRFLVVCLGMGLSCVGLFWWFMSVDPDWVVIVCLCVVDARGCLLMAVVCRHHVRGWVCGECDLLLAVGKEPRGQMIRDR